MTIASSDKPVAPSDSLEEPTPKPRIRGFSLIELVIVVGILGVLASVAIPQFLSARASAKERATVANLRTMVATQQMFFLNPAPLRPSSPTDLTKRYARLHELNAYIGGQLGVTNATLYIDSPGVRYSMVPLWPASVDLQGRFVIQAAEQMGPNGFIYQVDESGNVVKIR